MPETDGKDSRGHTYRDSGVDIDKANRLLSGLSQVIGATQDGSVLSDLSSFSGLFKIDISKYKQPVLASSTDGVGTKILLARETGDYTTIGQDLVAMSINDLVCCGARPLFFLDYIACGSMDRDKISTVIGSIADACRYCRTALLGGETAEMPDMYGSHDIDLAGFAVGIVEKRDILTPRSVKKGDILVGLESSGLHSNGFSLVRKVVKSSGLDLAAPLKWTQGKKLGEVLLSPTRLYSPYIIDMLEDRNNRIKTIANITGGGFYDNVCRIIPDSMDAVIHRDAWEAPSVFGFLQDLGNIAEREMYHVFNIGIGMVIITHPDSLVNMERSAEARGHTVIKLGKVTGGTGKVRIEGIDT